VFLILPTKIKRNIIYTDTKKEKNNRKLEGKKKDNWAFPSSHKNCFHLQLFEIVVRSAYKHPFYIYTEILIRIPPQRVEKLRSHE
jgi:hypothetical protein